jgi:hypothetical protein
MFVVQKFVSIRVQVFCFRFPAFRFSSISAFGPAIEKFSLQPLALASRGACARLFFRDTFPG